ncbi:MAG: hypothetical protein GF308_09175 [Candidatus Heimdallarchaeota archaeon]|nr:hypothetical protein [Candidatus Heimdallarchaeota archaeon]
MTIELHQEDESLNLEDRIWLETQRLQRFLLKEKEEKKGRRKLLEIISE